MANGLRLYYDIEAGWQCGLLWDRNWGGVSGKDVGWRIVCEEKF